MSKIGFIGLGVMGKPMAKNLLKAGYAVTVFSRSPGPVAELVEVGATQADSAAALAGAVDIVITMLPNSPDVEAVVTGPGGVLEGAKPGLIYVDCSSIAPTVARSVAEACAARDVVMLDAPVSGGEPKAVDGTLAIMVGGPEDAFATVEPVLSAMAGSVTRVGEVGAGNVTKLANQVIVGANIAAMSEALTLAVKAGVDPARVVDAIAGGLAGSTVLDAKAPMVLKGNYKAGFRIELHVKDLDNALDTGREVEAPLPLSEQVVAMMRELAESGHAADDHGGLIQVYEKRAGVEVRG